MAKRWLSLLVFWAVFTGHFPLITNHSAYAQVPHLIRYQGQAVDSAGQGLEGPYTITFRLCNSATGSTYVWEETQPNVPITHGHFSVLLGQVTPLTADWSQPLWLSVAVGDANPPPNAPPPAELLPRQPISSVPTALLAEQLDGPIRTVGNNVGIGTTTPADLLDVNGGSLVVTSGGKVGIGTTALAAATKLVVLGDSSVARFEGNNADLYISLRNTMANAREWAWLSRTAGAGLARMDFEVVGIGGSMMSIREDGNVGIGTTSPGTILTIRPASATDPIADSWTVYSTSASKQLLGPAASSGYLEQLSAVPLHRWKRAPLVSDEEASAALGRQNPTPAELEAKRQELILAKSALPKFTATRVGLVVDDPNVPLEVVAFNPDGTKAGLDLLAYLGYLHAALKEAALKIDELEARVNALSSH